MGDDIVGDHTVFAVMESDHGLREHGVDNIIREVESFRSIELDEGLSIGEVIHGS